MRFKLLSIIILILSFELTLSDVAFRRRKLVRKNYVELEEERNYLIHYNYTFIHSRLTHSAKTLQHKSDFLPWIVQRNENKTRKHNQQEKEIQFENDKKDRNKPFFFFSKTRKEKKMSIKESTLFDEKEHCNVKLRIPTLRFYIEHVYLCMFLAHWEEDVVEKMVVELKDNNITETLQDYAFMKKIQPVTGFVLNQRGSLVYGYIFDSTFYGQVRLFDMKLNHFIIYYIEPLVNLPLYKPTITMDEVHKHVRSFLPGANAFMFEYLMLHRASRIPIPKKHHDPGLPNGRGKKVVHSTISPDRPKTPKPTPAVYSTPKPRAPAEPAGPLVYSTTTHPEKNPPYTIIRSTPPSLDEMNTIIRSSTPGEKPKTTPLTIIHSSEVPEVVSDPIIHSTTVSTGAKPSNLPIIHSTTIRSNKTPLPIIHSTTKKTSAEKNVPKMMMGRSINDIVAPEVEDDEDDDDNEEPSSPSPCKNVNPPPPGIQQPKTMEPATAPMPLFSSPESTPESTRNTIIFSTTQFPASTTATVVPPKVTTTSPATLTSSFLVTSSEAFIHSTKTPEETEKLIIISTRFPKKKTSAHFLSTLAPKQVLRPHLAAPPASIPDSIPALTEESTKSTATAFFLKSSVAPKKLPRPPFFISTPRPPPSVNRKVFKSTLAPNKVSPRKFISSTIPTAEKVIKPPSPLKTSDSQLIQDVQPQLQQVEEFEEKRIKYTTVKASMEFLPSSPPPTTIQAARRRKRRRRRRAVTNADIDENDVYATTIKSDEDFGEELFERPEPRRRRSKRDLDDDVDDEWEHEHVHEDDNLDEEMLDDDDDIIEEVMYPKGNKATGKVEVFDLYRAESLLCNLCIWLQPEFAFMFGFQHGIHFGAAEIIDLVRYMNWVFRPMDFNMDYRPENIGFKVHKIMVVDIPEIDNIHPEEWTQDARKLMPLIKRVVSDKFPEKCCAILAYVYKNMDPFGSLSSRSAMCVKNKNFALVTGRMMGIKVAKYDVYRFTSHAIGHLIGALNDDSSDTDCFDKNMDTFNNQFIMHSTHQINIGIRPNAMRMSYCSRVKVSVFLSSSRPSCFEPSNYTYCGNGILEEGEDCDCGAPWQCEHIEECCGLRDSFNPCKVINKLPGKVCRLPQMMETDFEPEAEGEF